MWTEDWQHKAAAGNPVATACSSEQSTSHRVQQHSLY